MNRAGVSFVAEFLCQCPSHDSRWVPSEEAMYECHPYPCQPWASAPFKVTMSQHLILKESYACRLNPTLSDTELDCFFFFCSVLLYFSSQPAVLTLLSINLNSRMLLCPPSLPPPVNTRLPRRSILVSSPQVTLPPHTSLWQSLDSTLLLPTHSILGEQAPLIPTASDSPTPSLTPSFYRVRAGSPQAIPCPSQGLIFPICSVRLKRWTLPDGPSTNEKS